MFDPSAPHIIILLVVVLLLFGSTRLPGAAKALGSSMNIFKKSLKEGAEEEPATTIQPPHPAQATVLPPAAPAAPSRRPRRTRPSSSCSTCSARSRTSSGSRPPAAPRRPAG